MRSLVVLGGVLVAGASVFGLWQLKNKSPQVAGFKAVMPETQSIKESHSQKSADAVIKTAGMMGALPIADTPKQKLITALGGKPQKQVWWQGDSRVAGAQTAKVPAVSIEQKAQKKLVNAILDKAGAGAKKSSAEVKKNITYKMNNRVQQASASGRQRMQVTAPIPIHKIVRKSNTKPVAGSAQAPMRQVAMLSRKERQDLGQLVKDKKLHSINMVIEFSYKSARLSDVSLPALTKIGEALSDGQLADATFVIAGHTDSVGGSKYNLGLSAQRAQTVRNFLKFRYNISDDRLVAVGYGEERLKNNNEPEAAENRRVEFISLVR